MRQAEDQRAKREPHEGGGHDLAGTEPGVPPLQPVGRDDVGDDRGGGVEEGDVGGAEREGEPAQQGDRQGAGQDQQGEQSGQRRAHDVGGPHDPPPVGPVGQRSAVQPEQPEGQGLHRPHQGHQPRVPGEGHSEQRQRDVGQAAAQL